MDLTVVIAGAVGYLFVAMLFMGLKSYFTREEAVVADRLARFAGGPASAAIHGEEKSFLQDLLTKLGRITRPNKEEELGRLRAALTHAGFSGPRALEIYLGARVALAIVLVFLYLVMFQPSGALSRILFVCSAFAMIGFFLIPTIWLRRRVADRKREILSALPDTLDLLLTCLDAGQSLHAALERVAGEVKLVAPSLGDELGQCVAHIRAGMAQEVAFRKLAERAGVDELSALAALLHQAQVYGTSIAQTLRVHADSLRAHRLQRAEQQAATAAVRMTLPMIMFILPALLCVLMGPAIVQFAHNLLPALAGGAKLGQ